MPELRDDSFEQVRRDGAFDIIVVGGGINGIGVFRELALQGLRVLLVERNDFCSGCSAAPSRMIHGGLRYLENGEFDLVRESLRERDALLANAPHMVHPLPTMIPIRSVFSGLMNGAAGFFGLKSRPASRGALPVKIGLQLYDWVNRKARVLPRHLFLNARQTFSRWPDIMPDLRYSAIYYDAWIGHPERLGIELIGDARRAGENCIALNHAELGPDGDGYAVTDRETGEKLPVSTKVVVNATGAWVDDAIEDLIGKDKAPDRLVSGTKGSHIILDNARLHDALAGHMVFFDNSDGRVCVLFPYLGKVLAGSTDIRVKKAERVRCETEERDYILESIRLVMPDIPVSPDDVVFSYSGIRPLPKSDHDFTGRISRGHSVRRIDAAVPHFCMVGGKWTTFRAFAEQSADVVLAELGAKRTTDTIGIAIGGGRDFPTDAQALAARIAADHSVSTERAAHLADAYGTQADDVMSFCRGRNDDAPLGPGTSITEAEIVYLIRNEYALHLSDLILRRTSLAITGAVSGALIERVASVAAAELGWDEDRQRREIESFIDELDEFYGVSRDMLDHRTQKGMHNAQ